MSYAGTWNMIADPDADLVRGFTWYADEDQTELVNLTGHTALFQVRNSSDTVVLEATQADYITLGGALGTVGIDIPQAEMPGIGNYTWGIQFTRTSDGAQFKPLRGKFTVRVRDVEV